MIKVSVYTVFSNYNLEWLSDCINSISGIICDYNYEYIFTIYGQSDHQLPAILSILNRLNGNVKIHYRPELRNFIDATVYTIKQCCGEYVLRVDADDLIMPNALSRLIKHADTNDASMVFANYADFDSMVYESSVNHVMSCALVERDKYNYVSYLPNQTFRDGTSLMKTFNRYHFKISYAPFIGFIYRKHSDSLTGDAIKVKEMDDKING